MSQEQKIEKEEQSAAIHLPKECLSFVRKNPKIAEKAGKDLVAMHELTNLLELFKKKFVEMDRYAGDIEDGTKEELELFLKSALHSVEQRRVLGFKGKKESIDAVVEQLKVSNPEVVVTNFQREESNQG